MMDSNKSKEDGLAFFLVFAFVALAFILALVYAASSK